MDRAVDDIEEEQVPNKAFKDDKDYSYDTLACDDEQIRAHKLILSPCSPFFMSGMKYATSGFQPMQQIAASFSKDSCKENWLHILAELYGGLMGGWNV